MGRHRRQRPPLRRTAAVRCLVAAAILAVSGQLASVLADHAVPQSPRDSNRPHRDSARPHP
ncbi:hypothetical protein ACTVZO_43915 [Streptomyces sp. IBSNAI002]|uniref:hypothetical protein n=1 Tax=Streptomyces sp. IBSNAI002 TaxID=3457500 RepID=UPI003FD10E53